MNDPGSLFVFGASGHAKVVIDAIERAGGRVSFVCDDAPERHGTTVMGHRVLRGREELLARFGESRRGIVGIGDNSARLRVAAWLVEQGFELATVIHSMAYIGRQVDMGNGTMIMAGCVINAGAHVGHNVIVNTGATVDHDCEIGDGAHIAPGSHLCGNVVVGEAALLGAGSTVVPGIRIGARALIAAGSTVVSDVPEGARVGGNPCRALT
jgi:sugar O-acyltransferase (sialic acid O-acetyltransferase NeuD family)